MEKDQRIVLAPGGLGTVQPMDLRDWFAGMAMHHMIHMLPTTDYPDFEKWAASATFAAYTLADAMLAERKKNQ